jgi:O-antigen ligase
MTLVILVVRGEPQIAHATGTAGASSVFAALIIAIAGCAVVAVLTGRIGVDRVRLPLRVGRPAVGIVALVIVVAAVAFGPHEARKAWRSFRTTPKTSLVARTDPTARLSSLAGTRYPLWKVTLSAFDAHPLDGSGAGTTRFFWEAHATDDESIHDVHNIWLQNMAELGIPGLLLIVALAVAALAVGLRVRLRARSSSTAGAAAAFVAAFLVYLLAASVDWMWESTAVTVLALAGIAAVGVRLGGPKLRLRLPLRILLAALALAAGAAQLPGILSTTAIRHSQSAEGARQGSLALAWAQAAVDAEPWSASAYEQRGLVHESGGQLKLAAQDLRSAINREPQNYLHWLLLARVLTERGQLNAAVRAYDRSRHLYPRAAVFARPAAGA